MFSQNVTQEMRIPNPDIINGIPLFMCFFDMIDSLKLLLSKIEWHGSRVALTDTLPSIILA